jgi:hypothetical protein
MGRNLNLTYAQNPWTISTCAAGITVIWIRRQPCAWRNIYSTDLILLFSFARRPFTFARTRSY